MKKFKIFLVLFVVLGVSVVFSTKYAQAGVGSLKYINSIPVTSTPYAVAVNPNNGYLYITGINLVQIQDSNGNVIGKFGTTGTSTGQFNFGYSRGLAFDPSGRLYVLDSGNHRVQIFDAKGNYISQKFFAVGTGNGQFNDEPTAISIDSSGNVYMADNGNSRIQKFDKSWNFITKFGSYGVGNGQFSNLQDIANDSYGNVYAVDAGYYSGGKEIARINKFNSSGVFMTSFGSLSLSQNDIPDGQFIYPFGISVDRSNNIVFVSDYNVARVTAFDLSGKFLAKAQSPSATVFSLVGVASDHKGNIYVVNQANAELEKYTYTPSPSLTINKSFSSPYHVGDPVVIKWTSTGVKNIKINLMDYKGLKVIRQIATTSADSLQYKWIVPGDIDFDFDTIYTIAVSDISNPSLISKSGKIELLPTEKGNIIATLDSNSPVKRTIVTSPSFETDNVVLAVFDLKSSGINSTLRTLNIDINNNRYNNQNLVNVFGDVKMKAGSVIHSADVIAAYGSRVTFTDLNVPLPKDQTVPVTILGKIMKNVNGTLNNFSASTTLMANTKNIYAEDYYKNIVPVSVSVISSPEFILMNPSGLSLTSPTAILGVPVVSSNITVAYPVTFSFYLTAPDANAYISKNPSMAVSTESNGFANSSDAIITDMVALSPNTVSGDSANYYIIPAGTSRKFTFNGILRAGNGTSGMRSFSISKVYYGNTTTNLQSSYTNQNIGSLRVNPIFDSLPTPPQTPSNPTSTPTPPTPTTVSQPIVPPTVLPWSAPSSVKIGETLNFTLNWSGGPYPLSTILGQNWKIFVFFRNHAHWEIEYAVDFFPNTPTSQWQSGVVSTPSSWTVPANVQPGTYDVLVGMYSGSERFVMTPGSLVSDAQGKRYKVGTVEVRENVANTTSYYSNMLQTASVGDIVERLLRR